MLQWDITGNSRKNKKKSVWTITLTWQRRCEEESNGQWGLQQIQNSIHFGPPFRLSKNQQNLHYQHEWNNDMRSEILNITSPSIERSVNAAGELAKCVRISSRIGAQMGQRWHNQQMSNTCCYGKWNDNKQLAVEFIP